MSVGQRGRTPEVTDFTVRQSPSDFTVRQSPSGFPLGPKPTRACLRSWLSPSAGSACGGWGLG
eukprot:9937864-Alexandrium_andersonii.AAC.1